MVVGIVKLKLMAIGVRSLKEKRMIVKSLRGKVSHKFNVSISEVEELDRHQTIIIGISLVGNKQTDVEASLNRVICYIEENTEAELLDIEIEVESF